MNLRETVTTYYSNFTKKTYNLPWCIQREDSEEYYRDSYSDFITCNPGAEEDFRPGVVDYLNSLHGTSVYLINYAEFAGVELKRVVWLFYLSDLDLCEPDEEIVSLLHSNELHLDVLSLIVVEIAHKFWNSIDDNIKEVRLTRDIIEPAVCLSKLYAQNEFIKGKDGRDMWRQIVEARGELLRVIAGEPEGNGDSINCIKF